jgi:glycosyltransferase involved in cell wall biosynthesis
VRINFNLFGLDRTGGSVVLLRYVSALQRVGHAVSITTLGRENDPRFLRLPDGVDSRYLGLRSKHYKALVRLVPGHLGFPRREVERLRRNMLSADLQIATYSLTAAPAAASGAPVLYHAQHFEPLIVPRGRSASLARDSYRLGVYQTANCSWVASQIEDLGGTVRGIIPPGIDHELFWAAAERPSGHFRVLTLQKRAPWKGYRDVIAAVSQLANEISTPIQLTTYGPDRMRAKLGAVAAHHHGLVDQPTLAGLYRSSHVCVSASWYESFPLPPLEAMATGTPVICTAIGTEDYARHEHNCLIVPPEQPRAIVDALKRLLVDADLRCELIANGLTTAHQFTWSRAEQLFLDHAAAASDS